MKKNSRASWFLGVAAVGLFATSAVAQQQPAVVYDNSSSPLNLYFSSTAEFGDQISIGGGWTADSFRFEYFASGLQGDETGFVRFYANNGIPVTGTDSQVPGELLYQSPMFFLQNGNVPVSIENLPGIQLPDSFTWTVSVTGVTDGEVFGLTMYDPPTTGSSLNDIWQRGGPDGWELMQLPGLPPGKNANFGAVLTAVPEPGAAALFALGGVALLIRRRTAAS